MKLILRTAILWTIGMTAAFGRIGETPEECQARYGKALKTEGETTYFAKAGVGIAVHFFQGKADRLIFSSVEGEALTEGRAEILLDANGGEKAWVDQKAIAAGKVWATKDGARWAFFNPANKTLSVATRENVDRMNAARKAEDAARLKGF